MRPIKLRDTSPTLKERTNVSQRRRMMPAVKGLGFRVQGIGSQRRRMMPAVKGLGFRVQGSGYRVEFQGLGVGTTEKSTKFGVMTLACVR